MHQESGEGFGHELTVLTWRNVGMWSSGEIGRCATASVAFLATMATCNLQLNSGIEPDAVRIPPLRQVLQWFKDVVSPWWGICWNAGLPTLEQLQGAQSRHAGRLHQHTAGAKKERRTHSAIQKQSAPRKTRCCGEACVLIALSLVAILETLGAQIAIFDGVSPNSLAPVRNDRKTARSIKPGASLQGGYAPRAVPATGTMKAIVAWWRCGQARLARWFSERLISPAAVSDCFRCGA